MTKLEAIDIMKCLAWHARPDEEDVEQAIEALEQESILNKIKAEIEALPKTYPFVNHFDTYVKEDDVRRIIDKYKAKSEE